MKKENNKIIWLKKGTYAPSSSQFCHKCGVGESSEPKSSECTKCPADSYNPTEGGTCKPCGHGTSTPAGSSTCSTNDCSYVSTDGLTYKLSELMAGESQGMHGPVYDFQGQRYYVNICSKNQSVNTCIGPGGRPIETFACQVLIILISLQANFPTIR